MSELGPEARAVVEAGRAGDDPSSRDRARVRAALMTAIAVGGESAAAAGAAKGAVGLAGGLGWGKGAVVGLALGMVGVGIAAAVSTGAPPAASTGAEPAVSIEAPPPALRAEAPGNAPSARRASESPVAASSVGGVGGGRSPAPGVAPAPRAPALAPPAESEPATPARRPADGLEAETRGLGEAHGALKDGDPARALSLLDEQSTAYADGQLREERAAARILALCKLGRVDEARALAARFLADNPRSLLADRVRAACVTGDPR